MNEVLLNIMCLAHSSIQGRVAPPLCPEVGTVGVLGKLGLWVKLSISSKMAQPFATLLLLAQDKKSHQYVIAPGVDPGLVVGGTFAQLLALDELRL